MESMNEFNGLFKQDQNIWYNLCRCSIIIKYAYVFSLVTVAHTWGLDNTLLLFVTLEQLPAITKLEYSETMDAISREDYRLLQH